MLIFVIRKVVQSPGEDHWSVDTRSWHICHHEDSLHQGIVDDGLIKQLLVLRVHLTLRKQVSDVSSRSREKKERLLVVNSYHCVRNQLVFIHLDSSTIKMDEYKLITHTMVRIDN